MSRRVALTFDFDAISLWLARGMNSPGPVSRGEFGVIATGRLLKLLDKHDIRSTFFVPGHTADTYPEIVREIAQRGHEVALHGYCHESVSTLSREEEREVVLKSQETITRVTGTPGRGYRTPSLDFTPNTAEILVEAELEYDSSLMGDDYTPYYARMGDEALLDSAYKFGRKTELVEIPVSWSQDDYPYLEWFKAGGTVAPGLRRPDDMFANFYDDVRYMYENLDSGVATFIFHPQVIGRGHRILALERFIKHLIDLNVSFAQCIDIAAEFRENRDEA